MARLLDIIRARTRAQLQAQTQTTSKTGATISLGVLTQHYMEVSQCWQNPTLAKKRRMTVEHALGTLRCIRELALSYRNGKSLSMKAHALLVEIVDKQVEDPRHFQ